MKRLHLGILACALGLFVAVAPASAGEKIFLTIASGPTGGDWYTMGGTIGELAKTAVPGATVTVTTGGAVGNLSVVDSGKADIGISMASLYNEARTGTGEFQGKPRENVRAMAYLANIFMSFFLVAEESPIRSIEEIRERKIPIRLLTSTKASSPAVAAERMLLEYGIAFDDIVKWGGKVGYVSYAEASNLIKDGHADAWVGPMVSGIVELTTTKKMRMLPI
ncbi:MAG: TAXI family TRAP transporter solute-binding subunit, partial [Zetaproteobacteria bacterium]